MTTAEKASETKECKFCGCVIIRGKRLKEKWDRMQYCTQRCAAFHRGRLLGGWRLTQKECTVCHSMFSPRLGIPKGEWRRLKCCSKECVRNTKTGRKPTLNQRKPKYRMEWFKMDPSECRTPGQRLRFLRLSRSPEGTKKPITADDMATFARMRYSTLKAIESDKPTVLRRSIEKACAFLKIPLDMLGWTDKKWERVVSNIGLTAYELRKTES